jgi:predicted PurR-regulated permease PerM
MPFLESKRDRAAVLVVILGVALVIGLAPYATGLLGIPVLFVVFEPVHRGLIRHVQPRLAASLVVVLVVFVIVVPGVSFAGMVVRQAQQIAGGVLQNPLLADLSQLRIGQVDVGSQIADMGSKVVGFIGSSAFGLIGTATRLSLNLIIALFGLFYLLLAPDTVWSAVVPYIPFSARNTEKLKVRFRDVTTSTIIGTGLAAAIQGTLVGLGFWATGLSNGVFWGVVTMVFGILPVVGSGLVWGPGAISLAMSDRLGAGIGLAVWGAIVVGNVDYVIRPIVFRRWANIHPLITLVGALAGVPYFGLLGLLIGPLALSYFFELMKMYHEEYFG